MMSELEERSYYVTMGAVIGDTISAKVLDTHLNEMSTLLDYYCDKKYCPHLDEIAITLRVGGELWSVDFEGPKYMRLSKKHRHITIEIGMPPEKWQKKSHSELREFIIGNFKIAVEMMIKRIGEEKWQLDSIQLREDFNKVRSIYLSK